MKASITVNASGNYIDGIAERLRSLGTQICNELPHASYERTLDREEGFAIAIEGMSLPRDVARIAELEQELKMWKWPISECKLEPVDTSQENHISLSDCKAKFPGVRPDDRPMHFPENCEPATDLAEANRRIQNQFHAINRITDERNAARNQLAEVQTQRNNFDSALKGSQAAHQRAIDLLVKVYAMASGDDKDDAPTDSQIIKAIARLKDAVNAAENHRDAARAVQRDKENELFHVKESHDRLQRENASCRKALNDRFEGGLDTIVKEIFKRLSMAGHEEIKNVIGKRGPLLTLSEEASLNHSGSAKIDHKELRKRGHTLDDLELWGKAMGYCVVETDNHGNVTLKKK